MKCFAIVPAASATGFAQASWITLNSGSVLLSQDTDYVAFSRAVDAVGGSVLPIIYDAAALSEDQVAALTPVSIAAGSTMLQLASAAAAVNPLMSL